jgi:hypothetical protein
MIDDAFKLTLDIVYPSLKCEALPEPVNVSLNIESKFKVDGYEDDFNMWGEKFYRLKSHI